MTNFLTRRNRQERTAAPTAVETRQETFANAVAAFLQATGKAEARVVPCRCAVTGAPIPLEELKYWSVDLQEAYSSPEVVLQRHFPEPSARR